MRRIVSVSHGIPPENGLQDPWHDDCRVYWAVDSDLFIVGICHVQPSPPFSIWVSDLEVAPSVRRQGIGHMMVDKIRSDFHPKSIRGNSDLSAVHFWKMMGAKFGFTDEFVIEPRK